jgi:hypothetical protein
MNYETSSFDVASLSNHAAFGAAVLKENVHEGLSHPQLFIQYNRGWGVYCIKVTRRHRGEDA